MAKKDEKKSTFSVEIVKVDRESVLKSKTLF